eukprot:6104037-Amphidinium_carterae.1
MQAHTRRGLLRVSRQARFTAFLVPVRAVVNNVLKVLHSFSTPNTRIAYLHGRLSGHVPHAKRLQERR